MLVQECYEKMQGDYKGIMERMAGNELLVKKFALKFLEDKSYEELTDALKEENYEDAFRASHTLKGVASSLGFKSIYAASSILTEELRGRSKPEDDCYEKLSAAYEETCALLRQLD